MIKLLLFIIIFLLLIRIINALFKGIYRVTGEPQKNRSKYTERSRPKEGEITIDEMPGKKRGKGNGNFKGGEYIDYEEVK